MKFSRVFSSLFFAWAILSQPVLAQSLTLEDIFASTKYREKRPENMRFMQDDNFYTIQEGPGVVKKDTRTGRTVDTLVSKADTLFQKSFKLSDYVFSPDEKQLLLVGNVRPIYRRSFVADYVLRSIEDPSKHFVLPLCSYATFSPDGQKIAYVKENNL